MRALESIILNFQKLCKIFKESFWKYFEWIQRGKIQKSYFWRKQPSISVMQNIYSKNFSKNPIKPWESPFPVMLMAFSTRKFLEDTRRALEGHSKGFRTLEGFSKGIRRAFEGHLGTQDTRVLKHLRQLGTRRALGHSVIKTLGH